jgi:protocatechuate 3,4-dioxygenase beta subunit
MDHDPVARTDLTSIEGVEGLAQGEIIEVTVRVLNLDGEPVRSIPITVWQANTFGRYAHGTQPTKLESSGAGFGSLLAFDPTMTASIGSRPSG